MRDMILKNGTILPNVARLFTLSNNMKNQKLKKEKETKKKSKLVNT